jgi:signal transduction histidine kinase
MINKKKPLVLVVDDHPENLKMLGNILKENGCMLAFATNGAKALNSLKQKLPDLILLDIMMPGMNGFEVCQRLKQNVATKDIPVIFLSAKTEKKDVIHGLELGAVDYVTKPFNHKELITRVNTHLELKAAKEELKQTIEQLQQAYQAAEAANRVKNTFLANMSHELRTPLNGILGYTQLFQQDSRLSDEHQQGIRIIHRCGEYLLTLINDILELSKIEAGHLELNPNEFSLTALLDSTTDLFKMQAQQKGIAFNYQQLSPIPSIVHADENRLRQILINLLSNAVKFTKHGGVTFQVAYLDGKIRFQVEDTGIGIAPEELDHIFKPFLQIGNPNHKAQGTGLGLAITQQLVKLMGGELQVESTLGQGSTFSTVLDLPAVSTVEPMSAEPIIIGFEGSPRQILVVDDKWENRAVVVKYLKPLGFEIIEAENGQEAIDKALISRPDVIMIDTILPIMDGIETIQKLRKRAEFFDTVIIALSTNVFGSNQQQCLEAGCTDFIAKPIAQKVLLEKLQHHLNLTWIYEGTSVQKTRGAVQENRAVQENNANIVPSPAPGKGPSAEQAATLFDLSLRGDITAIQDYVAQLLEDDELHAFAQHLQELANKFKLRQIRKLVQPYMDKPA